MFLGVRDHLTTLISLVVQPYIQPMLALVIVGNDHMPTLFSKSVAGTDCEVHAQSHLAIQEICWCRVLGLVS